MMTQRVVDRQRVGWVVIALSGCLAWGCGSEVSTEPPVSETSTATEPQGTETPRGAETPSEAATPTPPPTGSASATPSITLTPTASATPPPEGVFTLTSPTFGEGDSYPSAYTCERDGGGGASPALNWSQAPEGTQAFAVTMHHYPTGSDPTQDDPSSYWLLWNVPGDVTALSAGNEEGVGTEGSDKDGVSTGYTPPCSPGDQVHSYTLRVYALSGDPESLGSDDSVSVDWAAMMLALEPLIIETAILNFVS